MSHAKLLHQRIQESIEAGHYRSRGTPRSAAPAQEAPAPKREAPSEKRERRDPGSYARERASKRLGDVGASVKRGLDERFKKK